MGLFPNVLDEAKNKGIDIAPKYIPAEVFDKRAVERNQVVFHDVAFIEVKPHIHAPSSANVHFPTVAVELTNFSVFYSQDSIAHAEQSLRNEGQPHRRRKRTDCQGEPRCQRCFQPRGVDQALDRLDRLLVRRF